MSPHYTSLLRFTFTAALVTILGAGCASRAPAAQTPSPSTPAAQTVQPSGPFTLSSSAFQGGQLIPEKYTCHGLAFSPPVQFANPPSKALSLALIVHDTDVPNGGFTHWIVYNMPASTAAIAEGDIAPGALGTVSSGKLGYEAPCPPDGAIHHYVFTLYALDAGLNVPEGSTREAVLKAMEGHILQQTELVGTYGS